MVQISLQNSDGKVKEETERRGPFFFFVLCWGSMVDPSWAPMGVKVPWSLKC